MNRFVRHFQMLALLILLTSSAAIRFTQAQTSKTIENYRLHMFDEPVRSIANRTIELMFDTSRVDRGNTTWVLPNKILDLNFTYEFNGVHHHAEDVLADTQADALLVIKNGSIVCERYLDRANAQTHFNSYSMAKSLNSIMVGMAIADGHVRIETGNTTCAIRRSLPLLKLPSSAA